MIDQCAIIEMFQYLVFCAFKLSLYFNCNSKKNKNAIDDSKEVDNSNVKNNNKDYIFENNECKDGFNCPIYKKVKNSYEYTEYNYKHLKEKNHFGFDYSNKPLCRYKSDCKAFTRVSRINENPKDFNCNRSFVYL